MKARLVYNGPWVVKFITATLSVYQYSFSKNVLVKKYLGKGFWTKKKVKNV